MCNATADVNCNWQKNTEFIDWYGDKIFVRETGTAEVVFNVAIAKQRYYAGTKSTRFDLYCPVPDYMALVVYDEMLNGINAVFQ